MLPPSSRHRQLLALLALSFVMFFVGLGRPAITDSDEGFYAEAAREMAIGGDWLTPHFNYEDRWQKPVLYYWLSAGTGLVTGHGEWSARAWSALAGVGLVLITRAAATRRGRHDRTAFIAGAIVATCYGYFAMARLALPDLPLAFLVTLAIWASLERRWAVAGLAAGLGFLVKGPLALLIPALVVLPILWRERESGSSWSRFGVQRRDLLAAGFICAIVALPWYAAMAMTHGGAYLQSFFVGDNLERFATTRFNGPRSLLFYVPILIAGMLPWSIYLIVLPWKRWIDVFRRRQRLLNEEWQLIIWCAMPLVFFTLSIGKQPRYILPVLPPLAILLADSLAKRTGPDTSPLERRGLVVATWLLAGFCLVLAVLLLRARGLLITAYPPLVSASIAALVLVGGAVAGVAVYRAWERLVPVVIGGAFVMLFGLQFGALFGVRPEPVEDMAALVRAHRTTEAVGEYQVFVRNLIYYTGFKHVELFNEARARDFLRSSDRVLLVVRATDLSRLESISGVTVRPLGEVRYLDPATVRLGTFLWPNPDEDLDTVLLVANR